MSESWSEMEGSGSHRATCACHSSCALRVGAPSIMLRLSYPLPRRCHRSGVYEAPTYRVKTRKGLNFVTTFALRTEDDKSKWILRGVAILCTID